MSFGIAISLFVLGAIIGSFLNVIALRYNTGLILDGWWKLSANSAKSSRSSRSQCMQCGTTLRWFELVPVASFICQAGRCRTCKGKISWQYPIVEILTGLLFVSVFWRELFHVGSAGAVFWGDISGGALSSTSVVLSFFAPQIFILFIFCLLLVIAVYDFHHTIIPDGLVYTFIFFSLVWALIGHEPLAFILAGVGLALPLFLLWLVSVGRWIGLGDAKLALGIGFFLGPALGISAFFLAFWAGAAVSIVLLLLQMLAQTFRNQKAKLTIKSEIPFAPFLILGTFAAYFFMLDVIGFNILFGQ